MRKHCFVSLIVLAAGSAAGQLQTDAGVTVLNPSREGATTVSGQALVHSRRLAVASTDAEAVVLNGQGQIECSNIQLAGGYSLAGRHAHISGAVWPIEGTLTDPLADRAQAINDLVDQYADPDESLDRGAIEFTGGEHSVEPGYYSGGMNITGGNISLAPGVYILGGDMSLAGQAEVLADGVTIILLEGDVKVAGGASLRMVPPQDGDLMDFSIVLPASNDGHISLTGNSGLSIQGSIYAPAGSMSVTGQAFGAAFGPFVGEMVVVDTLALAGRGSIIIGAMGPVNLISERKID